MRKLAVLGVAAGAGAAAFWFGVRPWWHTWGVDPDEVARTLPGDDILPDAQVTDTRGITIDAPPSAVWPWLVQMGFGRGGWYSYDVIDMKGSSADHLMPEHQHLDVGDLVPVSPDAGFVVKALDPGRSLVLSMDSELMRSQAEAARAKAAGDGTGIEATPANLRAAGTVLGSTSPADFTATWAFIVEDAPGARTRLIERLRVHSAQPAEGPAALGFELMGFGVFVMVRRQLLGIRERVERSMASPAGAAEPLPAS